MIKTVERIQGFADKLPVAPERVAFYAGMLCVGNAALNIEFGNPLLGGIQVLVGATTILAACNTSDAIEALDNRGNL